MNISFPFDRVGRRDGALSSALSAFFIGVPKVESRAYGSRSEHRQAYWLHAAGIRERVEAFL